MPQKNLTRPPKIDALRLVGLTDSDTESLEAHERFEAARFRSGDVSGRHLAGVDFAECELIGLTAHETDLRDARFVETRLIRLNAPSLNAPHAQFRNVVIDGSRIGSAELYEGNWQSVHVSNSKLGFVNLRGAKLQDVLFTDCTIDELDLGGVRANRVSFVGTTVLGLDVTHATLQHVDLRALELRRITGLEGLKGATMSSYQTSELAALFAQKLGIIVEG